VGVAIFYFLNVRVVEVDMIVISAKNLQLSRSSLITSDDFFDKNLHMDSTIFHSIYGILSVAGYYIFMIFGSAGFSFFGAEMLKKYLFQPKLPKPEEHILAKTVLRETSEAIIEKGRMVYSINDDLKQNRHKMTNIEADTKYRIMGKKIKEITFESEELKEMIEVYEKESNFEKENPLLYVVFGAIGVVCYIFGTFFFINNYYLLNAHFMFTDKTYYLIRTYLGQGFVYLLILLVYLMMQIAIFKGYQKMSELVPDWIIEKYYIFEDRTWTDNFLTLANMLLLTSYGAQIALCRQFPAIFADTGMFYWYNLHLPSVYPYHTMIYNYYPNASFIIFFLVGFFIVFFEPAPKQKLWKLVEEKKNDLKEKQEVINDNPGMI
jgi:hypothetical protein